MPQLHVGEDIQPLSEIRANMASAVKHINSTGRPLVLTQRGRGVAVLLGVQEYQRLQDRLALLEDIRTAEAQIEAQQAVSHEYAKARLLKAR